MTENKCTPFQSGNPVFDAFVTIVCVKNPEMDIWDEIHSKLLSLAAKEPGKLQRRSHGIPCEEHSCTGDQNTDEQQRFEEARKSA